MFCQKCGAQVPDGVGFCSGCGSAMNAAPAASAAPVAPAAPVAAPQPPKKNTGVIIGVVAAVAVIAIVLVVLFATGVLGGNKDKDKDEDKSETTETTVSQQVIAPVIDVTIADIPDAPEVPTIPAVPVTPNATDAEAATVEAVVRGYYSALNNVDPAGYKNAVSGFLTEAIETTLAQELVNDQEMVALLNEVGVPLDSPEAVYYALLFVTYSELGDIETIDSIEVTNVKVTFEEVTAEESAQLAENMRVELGVTGVLPTVSRGAQAETVVVVKDTYGYEQVKSVNVTLLKENGTWKILPEEIVG